MASTLPVTSPTSDSQNVDIDNEKGTTTRPRRPTWLEFLQQDISHSHADIPIILCCFVSGLCDSSAFNAWSVFVSMQTGNTIILALGASQQPITSPYIWLKSLTAIFLFLLGCLFFSQSRHLGSSRRLTLALSFLLQGILIFIAASLVQTSIVVSPTGLLLPDPSIVRLLELLPIGFLAFQSGGQIVTSRVLGFNEVPTTVLTSLYCDLMMDANLLKADNVKRNRRVAGAVALLLGGIIGGWLSRSNVGMATSLWIAGAIKVAIAVAWAVWKAKEEGGS